MVALATFGGPRLRRCPVAGEWGSGETARNGSARNGCPKTVWVINGGVGGVRGVARQWRQTVLSAAVGFVVFLAGVGLTCHIAGLVAQGAMDRSRAVAVSRLSEARARLEGEINATLYIAQGLVSLAATTPDLSQAMFRRFAAETVLLGRNIRHVALAPGDVVAYVYPLTGNEPVIGLDYRANSEQWPAVKRAFEERATVIAGPVDLVQGGRALIVRTPVFIAPEENGTQAERPYWGVVSLVIDSDGMFASAGLRPRIAGYEFAVRGSDGQGADGGVIMGEPALFEQDAVTLPVALPTGSWEIAARPVGGWNVGTTEVRLTSVSGVLVSAVLAFMSALLVHAQQRARLMALHDALTGLPNRRLLLDRLEQLVALSERTGMGFLVYFVDLNAFKPINDRHGHAVGDALLQEIGRRLSDETRKSDTVARVGGDEFVVVMPGLLGRPSAAGVAARLSRRVSEPLNIGGKTISVEASVGWACFPDDAGSIDEIMQLADRHMYRVKLSEAV